ncbi:MAG: putative addiction module antidote protein [Legionellales bacterium]|nr:MAG: putative addiction module antidote protein [Legionellales bacterium]
MGSRNVRKIHNKHLRNVQVAADYINHALASEDVRMILMAIRNVVDAQEGGITSVAERSALGRESMYKILSPNGNPKLATLSALFHGLGLKIAVYPENNAKIGDVAV